jgi:REP element-mobilizing transposase RayT
MKQKEAGIYRSEHFHSAGSVHFLTGVDSGKFFRSVGNVTADTIKHYIKESQGKPKAEIQSCGSRGSGQRRLDDFWIP